MGGTCAWMMPAKKTSTIGCLQQEENQGQEQEGERWELGIEIWGFSGWIWTYNYAFNIHILCDLHTISTYHYNITWQNNVTRLFGQNLALFSTKKGFGWIWTPFGLLKYKFALPSWRTFDHIGSHEAHCALFSNQYWFNCSFSFR